MGKAREVQASSNAGGRGRKPWRVVLADDHEAVLQELRLLLVPEFEIIRSANRGATLLEAAIELRPDAVVSDFNMPGVNGIEAGRQILQRGLCHAVIMLTTYNEPHLIDSAFEAGIRGYVLKIDAGDELVCALRTVISGGTYLSRRVAVNRI